MLRTDQRRRAVFICYRQELTKAPVGEGASKDTPMPGYCRELVEGVADNLVEIDKLISKHAQGWSIDRIAPLERCIMRVALYEIAYRSDIPHEVAIDEAVEIAKRYCGIDAPGFINGILGSALEEVKGRVT